MHGQADPTLAPQEQLPKKRPAASLVLVAAASSLLLSGASPADQGRVRYVTDGDTFRLESGERIRIAGIDAPETHTDQAKCAAELALGEAASARARALLDHRTVTFERSGKAITGQLRA